MSMKWPFDADQVKLSVNEFYSGKYVNDRKYTFNDLITVIYLNIMTDAAFYMRLKSIGFYDFYVLSDVYLKDYV